MSVGPGSLGVVMAGGRLMRACGEIVMAHVKPVIHAHKVVMAHVEPVVATADVVVSRNVVVTAHPQQRHHQLA
jgi:hypothetical protein